MKLQSRQKYSHHFEPTQKWYKSRLKYKTVVYKKRLSKSHQKQIYNVFFLPCKSYEAEIEKVKYISFANVDSNLHHLQCHAVGVSFFSFSAHIKFNATGSNSKFNGNAKIKYFFLFCFGFSPWFIDSIKNFTHNSDLFNCCFFFWGSQKTIRVA